MAQLKVRVGGVWKPAVPVGTPGSPGPQGAQGPVGPAGGTGLDGGAIPAGGVAGDYLVKAGPADYETEWTPHVQSGRILHDIMQGPWNGTGNASWTATLENRPYLFMFHGGGHSAAVGARDVYLQMDGVLIRNSRLWQNVTTQHQTYHTATGIITPTAGDHTFTMHDGGGTISDTQDYGFILLMPLPVM